MENAVDALKIAGSVLLLIIALTVNISTFSRVKTEFEQIIKNRENVKYAIDTTKEENTYVNYLKSSGVNYARSVTIETIVSSLRRLAKENYKVYIVLNHIGDVSSLSSDLKINLKYDLTYGNVILAEEGDTVIFYQLGGVQGKWLENNENSENFDKSISILYNKLKDSTFVEYFGLYKEENANISDAEKKDRKIITYVQKNN